MHARNFAKAVKFSGTSFQVVFRCFNEKLQFSRQLFSTINRQRNEKLFKILFYGTDDFSVKSLQALIEDIKSEDGVIRKLEIVTAKPKHGAANSVINFANNNLIKVYEWPLTVQTGEYDIGIVVSFGHLIPRKTISAFPMGMLNVHASLLPRWRGAAPIVHTILNGDKMSGVTIMKIFPKRFDVGDIIMQKTLEVPATATTRELTETLGIMGARALMECIHDLSDKFNNSLSQDESKATYAPKINVSMGQVNWNNCTCTQIDRMYRAFNDNIKLRTYWKDTSVKLLDMVDNQEMATADVDCLITPSSKTFVVPGFIFYHKRRKILCIRCQDGWVGFRNIGVPKKPPMSAVDFRCGYLSKVEVCEHRFEFRTE